MDTFASDTTEAVPPMGADGNAGRMSRPEKKPSLTASVFDYDGAFRLLPIKIRKEA